MRLIESNSKSRDKMDQKLFHSRHYSLKEREREQEWSCESEVTLGTLHSREGTLP
jgi:hypothetical protein